MSKQGAQIINMSELLSDEIGVEDKKQAAKEESKQNLKDTLEGKKETFSFGFEKRAEENEDEDFEETADSTDEDEEENEEPIVPEVKTKDHSGESDIYRNILKDMYGDSITHLIQENEEGEEVEVAIEDIEINKELYLQIVNSKTEEIKEEASKGKISAEGISDFARDLIEIDRNGGNISKLLHAKETITDPLDNLDITTIEGQKEAIFIRMKAGGQSDDSIDRLIRSYETEGILEDVAIKAEEELRAAVKYQIDRSKEEAERIKVERVEAIKSYRKELKNHLSEFELKDSIKNKIVLSATKQDEEGRFEMDNLYREFREDPKKSARLALFLLDEQEYIDQVTNKATQETKLTTASKLRISAKKGADVGPDFKEKKSSGNDGVISLSSLV